MSRTDDGVTNNRKIDKYPGCKDCSFSSKGENGYRKCECEKYVYPAYKPVGLLYGKDKCEHFKE